MASGRHRGDLNNPSYFVPQPPGPSPPTSPVTELRCETYSNFAVCGRTVDPTPLPLPPKALCHRTLTSSGQATQQKLMIVLVQYAGSPAALALFGNRAAESAGVTV
jgi:hypothetical protein